MQLSGFDEFLKKQIDNTDFLYSGYSTGICVLSPNLNGLEIVDEPLNPYNVDEIIYKGKGLFDYIPIPHYKSNHPKSHLIDDVIKFLLANNIKYQPIRDVEVIIEEPTKIKMK